MTVDFADILVLVLAGGEGRRIGGNKPRRLLHGSMLVERALATARIWSDDVALSVRSPSQVGDVTCRMLEDEADLPGPLAGLAAGLRDAQGRSRAGLLTIPCDMPFLPSDLAPRLADALTGDVQAAIATSGGFLHPVCALWRASALAALPSYLATRRRSLRGFAEHVGFAGVEWPTEPRDPFFNINNAGDLASAEAADGPH